LFGRVRIQSRRSFLYLHLHSLNCHVPVCNLRVAELLQGNGLERRQPVREPDSRLSWSDYLTLRFGRSAKTKSRVTALLDFTVPRGLHFSISKSPNALFRTSYAMDALPSLHGSVGYIFTSCELDVQNSHNVRLKDMVERFKVYSQPRQPEGKEEEWLAGERVDTKGEYVCSVIGLSIRRVYGTCPRQTICFTVECTFPPVEWMLYTLRG